MVEFFVTQVQLDMEGALTARDRVGIQDFVLLDETTEEAVLSNLKKRFSNDLIYVRIKNKSIKKPTVTCVDIFFLSVIIFNIFQTYIGTLLVSVNPYKELDIYNKTQMELYMGVNFFELPPHM